MSQRRQEMGLRNGDGTLSRRAVRMKVGTRSQRRKSTKSHPENSPRARELVRLLIRNQK